MSRIAVIDPGKCKPNKCQQECKKACPIVAQGYECISVSKTSKIAFLSEDLCVGCGLCVKKCPFGAITIINVPKNLDDECSHRYGPNSFKLHRLPIPRPGQVLGLVGTNGIGKSTTLKILANKLQPNLGNFNEPPSHKDILANYRGSPLQAYLQKCWSPEFKTITKPQYVDQIPKVIKGTVGDILRQKNELSEEKFTALLSTLELTNILNRNIEELSGGELQRLTIAMCAVRLVDAYFIDEPSSFLDIKQRLAAAKVIREMVTPTNYVMVVEHDLAILDYLSDYICCLYGTPGAFGVVTVPSGVKEGINIFLDGFIPSENMRFRDYSLNFKFSNEDEIIERTKKWSYPQFELNWTDFHLTVTAGQFTNSEIIVLLGQNGTGKTSFVRALAGMIPELEVPEFNVSYKPQKISPKFRGTVLELLQSKILTALNHVGFREQVYGPLNIESLEDQNVLTLSGGELQRVAITLCLGKPADIYLIDEPSAYLDSEQRMNVARIIKRFIISSKKTAFIVEHDFMMSMYLADRVIVYSGEPGKKCYASAPQSVTNGMNTFLKDMEITFRQDPTNFRPRINKLDSVKDREQKESGQYFYMT